MARSASRLREQFRPLITGALVTAGFKPLNLPEKVAEKKMESGQLQPGDQIYIQGPTTGSIELIVPEIQVDLKPVEKTIKGENCSIAIDTFLRRADKVYKIISNSS